MLELETYRASTSNAGAEYEEPNQSGAVRPLNKKSATSKRVSE